MNLCYILSDGNGRFVRNIVGGGYKIHKWSWTTNPAHAEMLSDEDSRDMGTSYSLSRHKITVLESTDGKVCAAGIEHDDVIRERVFPDE